MSQLLASGGHSIGALASVLQWLFRVDLLKDSLIWSLCCPRDSQEYSPAPQFESINFLVLNLLYSPKRLGLTYSHIQSHICTWLLEKTIVLTIRTFVGKVMSLTFNTLSRFVMAFLPRSKHLLISWLVYLFMFWFLFPQTILESFKSHCDPSLRTART